MANRISDNELNVKYTAAAYRFASASGWKEYLALADEFRAMDTYRDAAVMYQKCVKAASAPAYREVKEHLDAIPEKTAEDYREAARVMALIQDYQDAREMMRVYTVKANALIYEEAMALVSNSEATTEELGRGVELFKSIKTFKNARDLIERYEKYYFNRMYEEASELMQHGHVWSEFDEAADIFEKISEYSDAAEQAAKCRKRANQLRPKRKKVKEPAGSASTGEASGKDETVRMSRKELKAQSKTAGTASSPAADTADTREAVPKKQTRPSDETVNHVAEVWKTLDKRRLVFCVLWFLIFVGALYASVWVSTSEDEWVMAHLTMLRGIITPTYIIAAILCVREFLFMLTKSMRKKLGKAILKVVRRVANPLIRAVTKLLHTIGIDLTRRNRLGGRDEKTFVYAEEVKEKKVKKKLKNDLKWADQPDNVSRVRFIFIDYMIRKIKGGYMMRRTMTPVEIGRDIALEDDEKQLFRVYNLARYAGKAANEDIPDAMIGELKAVNQRRT